MGNLKTDSKPVQRPLVTPGNTASNVAPRPTQAKNSAANQRVTSTDDFEVTTPAGKKLLSTDEVSESVKLARSTYPELAGKSDAEVKSVLESFRKLKNGPTLQDSLSALASLHTQFPNTLKESVSKLGIKNATVLKFAANKELSGALAKALDPSTPVAERVGAGITVAKNLGDAASLNAVLPKLFAGLPAGAKLASSLATMMDPAKGPLEKAGGALEFFSQVKDSVGEAFPKLANDLRATNSGFAALSNALTVVDSSKSMTERATALAQLAGNGADLAGDLAKLKQKLGAAGAKTVDELAPEVTKLGGSVILSADNAKSLPKEVADKLSLSEAKILEKAAANPDLKDNLAKVLLGTKTPQAATNLTEFLSKADPKVAKEVVATLAGLEHETMAKVLTETIGGKPGLQAMTDLVSKLPAISRPALAKVIQDFDPKMLETFFELAGKADPKMLGKVLETLSGANSKAIGKGLNVVMELVGKIGVKMGPEVAGHLLKGLTRMVPLVGTLPALYSMGDLGLKAIDQNSPPELRFLAGIGVGANTVDAALGVIEALGVTNVDAVVQIPLGIAEIGIDLAYMAEKQKYDEAKKAGQPYVAPRWLDNTIVTSALVQPQVGIPAMISMFGIEGTQKKFMNAGTDLAKLSIDVQEMLGVSQAQFTGDALKLTAKGIDALADVIRNPEKYGKMAKDMLQGAYRQLEAAGEKGVEILKQVTGEIYETGKAGFEKLKWMTQNPGPTAKIVLDTIGDIAKQGIETGKALVTQTALQTLNALHKVHDVAKKGWTDTQKFIGEKTAEVFDYANKLVERGGEVAQSALDTIEWGIKNPGEISKIAKNKLIELTTSATEAGKAAYEWTLNKAAVVKGAANDFLEVTKRSLEDFEAQAKNGVKYAAQMIAWTAQNPGKAAEAVVTKAIDSLSSIAQAGKNFASEAVDALADFANRQGALAVQAKKELVEIIDRGTSAGKRVLAAWSQNLTEGGKAVINSLSNLKGAVGDLMIRVAQNGGEVAKYVETRIREGLQTGADYAWKTVEAAKKKGSEWASWAVQTVANSVPAQFAKRGFDFLVNSGFAPTQIADTVYRFVQRTDSALSLAKDVYAREGWQGIANLASRAGNSAVGEFVRVLAPTVQVVKENVQSVAESVGKVLGKRGLEELTGWNLTPYWPSWAPQ